VGQSTYASGATFIGGMKRCSLDYQKRKGKKDEEKRSAHREWTG